MAVLASSISAGSSEFETNSEAQLSLINEISKTAEQVALGGTEAARQRHVSRGKLLPRQRVNALLDPGSPFLEVGMFAANELYGGAAPGAGLITGIGRVSGREVMVVCNDATVKGGTYFPHDGQKAPACSGNRRRKSAAMHLFGRQRRRQSAESG